MLYHMLMLQGFSTVPCFALKQKRHVRTNLHKAHQGNKVAFWTKFCDTYKCDTEEMRVPHVTGKVKLVQAVLRIERSASIFGERFSYLCVAATGTGTHCMGGAPRQQTATTYTYTTEKKVN